MGRLLAIVAVALVLAVLLTGVVLVRRASVAAWRRAEMQARWTVSQPRDNDGDTRTYIDIELVAHRGRRTRLLDKLPGAVTVYSEPFSPGYLAELMTATEQALSMCSSRNTRRAMRDTTRENT